MSASSDQNAKVSRRSFLKGATVAGAAAAAGPVLWRQRAYADAPATVPEQLHLTFGHDPTSTMVATWGVPVSAGSAALAPAVRYGLDSSYGATAPGVVRSYYDAKDGVTAYSYHATMGGLVPATTYFYEVLNDTNGVATRGSFTTAPRGRAPFTFTSFGDQATPEPGNGLGGVDYSADVVGQVEKVGPAFHLLNGDLCYANISTNPRTQTWADFFNNNSRSAANRPWMPAAGNHENERNNAAAIGGAASPFLAYQTRFDLPSNGSGPFAGLWYSFTYGSVRVISLNNDDVCLQDGGDTYVNNYSGGAQRSWLAGELAAARADPGIDWVVVCMHQVAMSSAMNFNGADLGIRQSWLPLFDRYGVDLVVCGHEHHYERMHPVRGIDSGAGAPATMRPAVQDTNTAVIDTTKGTVHMIIGGGGTSAPSNKLLYNPPMGDVIVSVSATPGSNGKRTPTKLTEAATWSAFRDADHAYGFVGFAVDPGKVGGLTTMKATYYVTTESLDGTAMTGVDSFVMQRPRSDAAVPIVPEFGRPALVVAGAGAVGAGALWAARRASGARDEETTA